MVSFSLVPVMVSESWKKCWNKSVLDWPTGIITVTWGIDSKLETMGWKLELGPGTLDFPVDFDDLRWQKKSITKGKGLYVEFDGRTHEHLKGPPAALLTILQYIEKKEHKSG